MKLFGKLVGGTRIIKEAFAERAEDNTSFRDALEECFLDLCRKLEITVPLWLKKNSKELGAFHKTSFLKDQFIDKVKFDRLEIRIEH